MIRWILRRLFSFLVTKMVMHCPECRTQHIDCGEWRWRFHRHHLCSLCSCVFAPLPDDYTVGVGQVKKLQTCDGGY